MSILETLLADNLVDTVTAYRTDNGIAVRATAKTPPNEDGERLHVMALMSDDVSEDYSAEMMLNHLREHASENAA